MPIIRPITESQVEINLSREDGLLNYPGAFMSSTPVEIFFEGGEVVYNPIVVYSVFDPKYYKELYNFFIESLDSEKDSELAFTLEFKIHRYVGQREAYAQYQATGCKLIGVSLPKFNRESVEVAQFSLTLQPKKVTRILT